MTRQRILLIVLLAWALVMIVPDVLRVVQPLGSFGFYADNDGMIYDVTGPFEGYAPNKVPIIVEILTDNNNRTAPEIRVLFKKGGLLGAPGSNKFVFDHVGLVEAHHTDPAADIEAAAIEAGAQNVEPLSAAQNEDIPEGTTGARFITERADLHAVSQWLAGNG